MHRAGPEDALVLCRRRSWLGALHVDAGDRVHGVDDAVAVAVEEGEDGPDRLGIGHRPARRVNGWKGAPGRLTHDARRARRPHGRYLELVGIHRGDQPVTVVSRTIEVIR